MHFFVQCVFYTSKSDVLCWHYSEQGGDSHGRRWMRSKLQEFKKISQYFKQPNIRITTKVSNRCIHAMTRLRKIFENLHNIFKNFFKKFTKEQKTGKSGTNFIYFSQFDMVCLVSPLLFNF